MHKVFTLATMDNDKSGLEMVYYCHLPGSENSGTSSSATCTEV